MLKQRSARLSAITLAIMATTTTQSALAGYDDAGNNTYIWDQASVVITGNDDNNGGNEGVFIRSNNGAAAGADFVTNGQASIYGQNTEIFGQNTSVWVNNNDTAPGTGTFSVYDRNGGSSGFKASLSSNATQTSIATYDPSGAKLNSLDVTQTQVKASGAGATMTLNGTEASLLNSTEHGLAVSADKTVLNGGTRSSTLTLADGSTELTVSGATSGTAKTLFLATTDATTTTSAVTIGEAGNTVNTITGSNNSMVATGSNTITGVTNVNVSNNAATNINTGSSTANVTVGNAANTTFLNSATNNIGVTAYATINNIGTGTARSTNNIGNTQTATTVTANAGNAQMALANNSATMIVPSGAAGVANGFAAAPTNASMTGGDVSPTRLTMSDSAATFSRVSNGAPITVTGVADGKGDFDAVNVRQFAGAIAATAAMAHIPSPEAGKDLSVGVGLGNFMTKTALAFGGNYRMSANSMIKAGISTGLNGGAKPVAGIGAGWSW